MGGPWGGALQSVLWFCYNIFRSARCALTDGKTFKQPPDLVMGNF